MPLTRSLLATTARCVPASVVRAIGRRTGNNRVFAAIDRIARTSLRGSQTIRRGAGAGLLFDAGGGRPGFVLGTWEPEVQDALAALLESGQVVYDVGAASGFYAVIAGSRVKPDGEVIAFEPVPDSAARLRRNVALNGLTNIRVFEVALGDEVGRAKIVAGLEEDQGGMTVAGDRVDGPGLVDVDLTTIDELVLGGQIPPPDVIKMDIEGGEVAALRGAAETLASHRPVLLIEVHDCWEQVEPLLAVHDYTHEVVEEALSLPSPEPTHVLARPMARPPG